MITFLNLNTIFYIFIGTIFGIFFGAMPGLTSTAAVAMLIPLTYRLDDITGIGLLLGAFCGGTAGGAIPAALLNIPGTPSSICTTFDAFPMVKKGKAGRALGISMVSSFIGGLISAILLICVAPFVAELAINFGPFEYTIMLSIGMILAVRVFNGDKIKAFLSMLLGVLFSMIGADPITGVSRLSFNNINLRGGIHLLPLMVGFFAISQTLISLSEINEESQKHITNQQELSIKIPSIRELLSKCKLFLSSSAIGSLIGVLPGAGGSIASITSYSFAKNISKEGKNFGKGVEDGIIASETSNNAMTGGALIPTLALGIPGDACTAVMLGGMRLLGINTGPDLFSNNLEMVYGIFTSFVIANIIMFSVQLIGNKFFIKILIIPQYILFPIVCVFSVIGVYCVGHNFFDLYVMIFFGILGYFLSKYGFGIVSCLMGFILGGLFEQQLRRTFTLYDSIFDVFSRPIACVLLVFLFIILLSFFKRGKIEND